MIALLQRVSEASVDVDGSTLASIEQGILVLVAVEPEDGQKQIVRMVDKILGYRIFADETGRMNRSVRDINGGVLLVPQFTLAANTNDGLRPNFSTAAQPELAKKNFLSLFDMMSRQHQPTTSGVFGADMAVSLINSGPATFYLRIR